MKSRTLLIVGGVIVGGIAAYAIYNYLNNRDSVTPEYVDADKKTSTDREQMVTLCEEETDRRADYRDVRRAEIREIKQRHNEAANAVREALNTIFDDSDSESIVTENSEGLAQMRNELDELLK